MIPPKTLAGFCVEINRLILKRIWRSKGPRIVKIALNKTKWITHTSLFKIYNSTETSKYTFGGRSDI